MIRLLTLTALYPNAAMPNHGVFVENRLRRLVATGRVSAQVIAPVPWFPVAQDRFGAYGRYAQVPAREDRHGIAIAHPRYGHVPKIGMRLQPDLFLRGVMAHLKRHGPTADQIDAIDAHYLYPDGIAAMAVAQALVKPFTVTARGSDVTEIPDYPFAKRRIGLLLERADRVIAVAEALRQKLIALGGAPDKIVTLRNGVDLDRFQPEDRAAARARFGIEGRALVSVGALIERKGHHLSIEAIARLPEDVRLYIAGEGPMRQALSDQIARAGLERRVKLMGPLPHDALPALYSAADASLLASSREGMANVLLESIACGCPVVATPVDGTPEVIADPAAGLLAERDPAALAAGIARLLDAVPDRQATRAYATRFGWEPTMDGLLEIFSGLTRS